MTAKIGYIRISNPEKQDIASQRKLMADLGITNIFEDFGSGTIPPKKRSAYKELLIYLDIHPEVNELVMSEYSRLGRTVSESLQEVLDINRRGIKLTSLSRMEEGVNNIPQAFQIAVISLMMGAAQMEREHISERTRWGLDNARAKGKNLGRPRVKIEWDKVKGVMEQYKVPEKVAARICGYNESTFYKAKRERAVNPPPAP